MFLLSALPSLKARRGSYAQSQHLRGDDPRCCLRAVLDVGQSAAGTAIRQLFSGALGCSNLRTMHGWVRDNPAAGKHCVDLGSVSSASF